MKAMTKITESQCKSIFSGVELKERPQRKLESEAEQHMEVASGPVPRTQGLSSANWQQCLWMLILFPSVPKAS
jgi:CMP-N-acetylneuraminic acid synthetase